MAGEHAVTSIEFTSDTVGNTQGGDTCLGEDEQEAPRAPVTLGTHVHVSQL